MNVYKNAHSNVVYPFTREVPFPLGWLQDVKLGLKEAASTVFISAIGTTGSGFYVQLQTQRFYIGHFQTQQQWLSIDNQEAFGFIKFGSIEQSNLKQSYSGRWNLCRSCYALPIGINGISQVLINGMPIEQPQDNILNVQLTGDLTQRQAEKENIANIGRDSDPHKDYNAVNNATETYTGIMSINGNSVKSLVITSSDSSWLKVGPATEVIKSGGNYVIYLSSAETFQGCDQSNSQSYFPPGPARQIQNGQVEYGGLS